MKYRARSPERGLLLGFGRLPEHKFPLGVDALWKVIGETGTAPAPAGPDADQPGNPCQTRRGRLSRKKPATKLAGWTLGDPSR